MYGGWGVYTSFMPSLCRFWEHTSQDIQCTGGGAFTHHLCHLCAGFGNILLRIFSVRGVGRLHIIYAIFVQVLGKDSVLCLLC